MNNNEEVKNSQEEKINKKYVIEKVKAHKKILCLVGSIVLTYIVPLVAVSIKFGLFSKETKTSYKITGMSLLLLVVLAIKFSSWIKKTIEERIKKKIFKQLINVAKNLILVVMFIVLVEAMKENLLSLEILAIILGVSFSLGNWLDEEFKDCLNKDDKWKQKQETLNILREFEKEKDNK